MLNTAWVLNISLNPYRNPVGKYSLDYLSNLPEFTQPVNSKNNIQSWVNFNAMPTVLEILHEYVMLEVIKHCSS